jgi:broad specificity phosphatase PhoE
LDVPLTPAGAAEVEELLRAPPNRPAPVALFTSPLARARSVADALGRVWRRDPTPADWAREIDCGRLEGMPLEQVRREFPQLWERNEAQDDDGFAWPGGESYAQFRHRVLEGLAAAAAAHAGGSVAVVTHAGVISQVIGTVRRRPASVWAPDRPDPLSATEILWEHGQPTAVLAFNDRRWY